MAYRKQNNRNKVLDIVLGIVAVVVLVLATLFTLEVTGTVDFKGMVDDVTEKVENLFEKEENIIISSITLTELENIKTSAHKDVDIKYSARKLTHLLSDNPDKYQVWIFKEKMLDIF